LRASYLNQEFGGQRTDLNLLSSIEGLFYRIRKRFVGLYPHYRGLSDDGSTRVQERHSAEISAHISGGSTMKFAKVVFWIAGIWGFLVLTPLYFMFDVIGRQDPPAITHPGFFYGFISVGLAWQIAFLFIAGDPVRFRPMMVPSVIEKFGYAATLLVLYSQQRIHPSDLVFAGVDALLGVLFLLAFFRTSA
jgi:hypothetical protein